MLENPLDLTSKFLFLRTLFVTWNERRKVEKKKCKKLCHDIKALKQAKTVFFFLFHSVNLSTNLIWSLCSYAVSSTCNFSLVDCFRYIKQKSFNSTSKSRKLSRKLQKCEKSFNEIKQLKGLWKMVVRTWTKTNFTKGALIPVQSFLWQPSERNIQINCPKVTALFSEWI